MVAVQVVLVTCQNFGLDLDGLHRYFFAEDIWSMRTSNEYMSELELGSRWYTQMFLCQRHGSRKMVCGFTFMFSRVSTEVDMLRTYGRCKAYT